MNALRPFFAVLAAFSFAAAVLAGPNPADSSSGDDPEWAELFGDASLPVVWQSATASAERIAAALAERTLEGVDDWAETIHLAAHALLDRVELADAERRRRLEAVLEQAAKLADEVLEAAQHGERDQALAAFRRLQAALTVARLRLPEEVTEAAPQTPRFAEAPQHAEHEHQH